MRTNLKATGMELTDALRSYVETKVEALNKFISPGDESAMVDVEIGRTTAHHKSGDVFKAEFNLTRGGSKMIREEVVDEDLYAAIDKAKDKLAETLSNEGHKKVTMLRKGGRAIKNLLRGFSR